MSNKKAIAEKQTELQIIRAIAEETEMTLSDVKAVFESTNKLLQRHMKKGGSGEFKFPKMGIKVERKRRKATKARAGRNPLTGDEIKIAAKPACNVIKIKALKALKELV